MPSLTPYHTLNASFMDAKFTPDARHVWLLSRHELTAHDIEDHSQNVLWRDDSASFEFFCFAQERGVVFVLGRCGLEGIVLVELDLHSGRELRRFDYLMSHMMDQERFGVFTSSDDLFSVTDAKVFVYKEDLHLVARCSDECGEFFLHWSKGFEVNPLLFEISPEGVAEFSLCMESSCLVIDDFLYDFEDRCIVACQPQETSALRLNPLTQHTLRYVPDSQALLVWSSESSAQPIKVKPEHISENDGWNFPSFNTRATSKDAQWLICLDAWFDDIPAGRDDYSAHIGIWNTKTGKRHAECLTQTFTEWGGRLLLSSDQRFVCVSYDDTIELFTLQLPDSNETVDWLSGAHYAHEFLQFPMHEYSIKGEWSECPLSYKTISVLDDKGVRYTGMGVKKRSHQLPVGISWVDMATRESWGEHDPKGQFNVVAPMVWCILSHLQWPSSSWSIWDRVMQEYVGIEFIGGASEQLDCVVDGRRRLIHFIAYSDNQYYYGVDVLERGADVPVFILDHDFGDGASIAFHTFENFVNALRLTEEVGEV